MAFVAPWCDFSKALLPEVDRVAEAFEGEAYVAVATVDGEKWDALAQRCVVVVSRGWLVLYSLLCALVPVLLTTTTTTATRLLPPGQHRHYSYY